MEHILKAAAPIGRRPTRRLMLGPVPIGGGAPVSIQSMTTTATIRTDDTLAQIAALEAAGCQIVRVAVPDMRSARSLGAIVAGARIPVVADIHFNHKIALEAIRQGVHGLRINPGNIGGPGEVRAVAEAAGKASVPIRVGVNGGSLPADILNRHGQPTAEGMLEALLSNLAELERTGFSALKVSLKATSERLTIEANRLYSEKRDYPVHLGLTEAGTPVAGTARSSAVLATLLLEGIGDTVRISLSGDPVNEVIAARNLLEALGLRHQSVRVIACPTCGRTSLDVAGIAAEVERRTAGISAPLTVAVMGCAVNGPGEAREADIAIAGAGGRFALYIGGRKVATVAPDRAVEALVERVLELAKAGAGDDNDV